LPAAGPPAELDAVRSAVAAKFPLSYFAAVRDDNGYPDIGVYDARLQYTALPAPSSIYACRLTDPTGSCAGFVERTLVIGCVVDRAAGLPLIQPALPPPDRAEVYNTAGVPRTPAAPSARVRVVVTPLQWTISFTSGPNLKTIRQASSRPAPDKTQYRTAFTNAVKACSSLRGRLPLPTEAIVARDALLQSGAPGNSVFFTMRRDTQLPRNGATDLTLRFFPFVKADEIPVCVVKGVFGLTMCGGYIDTPLRVACVLPSA
jgi:hypothetical protein